MTIVCNCGKSFFLIINPVNPPVIAAPTPAIPNMDPTMLSSITGGGPESILDVQILSAR
ncbi:MAG: hypothetical protein ACXAAI_07040 [Promethearchaeota archaeon]